MLANLLNAIHLRGHPVEMHRNHRRRLGAPTGHAVLDGRLQGLGVQVPGLPFGIYKYGNRPLVNDGIGRGRESHALAEDLIACLHPHENQGQVQGRRSAAQRRRMVHPAIGTQILFETVHMRTQGGNPIGRKGFLHIALFGFTHVGRGEPNFGIHRVDLEEIEC